MIEPKIISLYLFTANYFQFAFSNLLKNKNYNAKAS